MSAETQLNVQDVSAVKSAAQQSASSVTPLVAKSRSIAGLSTQTRSTSDALAMQVRLSDPAESTQTYLADLPDLPTHVVRLSSDGLRFNHPERFDQSQRIWLTLRLGRLDTDKRTIVTAAEVISSDSTKDHLGVKCFDTRVRFIDTTREFQSTIQIHIDDVISKVCGNCREYTYVPGGVNII